MFSHQYMTPLEAVERALAGATALHAARKVRRAPRLCDGCGNLSTDCECSPLLSESWALGDFKEG